MYPRFAQDKESLSSLLETAAQQASHFYARLSQRPAAQAPNQLAKDDLPGAGSGAARAAALFLEKYQPGISASAGPRYFGFVTGGSTPAAIMGDWLATTYDQNVIVDHDSIAAHVEVTTVHMLRQLFQLPNSYQGSFVSGATISNLVGLAQAREWAAAQAGLNILEDGLYGMPPIPMFSATPHSSSFKSAAILGMGKNNLQTICTLPGREAIDVPALAIALRELRGQPAIVVASAGTVNTADFDDLSAIAALKERHPFWLHVDAAFGGFAACSPQLAHLLHGLDMADSITIDAHKWLNVPYDSAMQFSRHPQLQWQVFQNAATYLGPQSNNPNLVHWTPQNSRRFRALPVWMSLMAYGRDGYRELVERNCAQAKWLANKLAASPHFHLLAPVHLNVVCFTQVGKPSQAELQIYLDHLRDDGRVFLTPTVYKGTPAVRAAISNWQTEQADMEICWQALSDHL